MAEQVEQTRFSEWLRDYLGGGLDDKLTAALAETAQTVQLLEKPGTVTLKLKLSEKGGGIVVEASATHQAPVPKTSGQFFYVGQGGALSRRDPKQPQLPSLESKD